MSEERTYLTEEQAQECLPLVQEWIDRNAGPGWVPALYAPGHEGPFWNISLEGAHEDWPYHMAMDESVTWPDGVYVEALDHRAIALHPES